MKKSRVLWGLWLLMSVIFCMATDSMAGYLLVLLSVIVPLLAALPVRRAAKVRNRTDNFSLWRERHSICRENPADK